MKTLILTLILAFTAFPVMASENWLKPAESQYICMMNDQLFDRPQIAIKVEDKTYYGCCPMCADKIKSDASLRSATDPVSGSAVDKAEAVIGTDPNGMVYYFENEENFQNFAAGPMPEEQKDHGMKDMMKNDMNHYNGHDDHEKDAAPETTDGHESHH